MRTFSVLLLIMLVRGCLPGNRISGQALADFTQNEALAGASIAVHVSDVLTAETLYEWNPDLVLAPASTMKLVTSAAVLQYLGAGFRFTTTLGIKGSIESSSKTLKGDLVITGGGDPGIASGRSLNHKRSPEFFDDWIESMKRMGILNIQGNIILDISGFQSYDLPSKWVWEDIGNYYGAGPSALNIYDNAVILRLDSPESPGQPVRFISATPEIQGVEWKSEVVSSVINRDMAYVYGSPWDTKRIIRGTIPLNRRNFEVKASMPDPPAVFGDIFKKRLLEKGIQVTGKVVKSHERILAVPLHNFYSPPVSQLCSLMNHESDNLIAESLVMQLAYQKKGYGRLEDGNRILEEFLKSIEPDLPVFVEDGSGLSRFNGITARHLNTLLIYMNQSKNSAVFRSGLPVAGSGTLRVFNPVDFPGQSLRGKSGSMSRVRAYAGYLTGKSGRELAFAIMVNNFPGTQQEVFNAIEGLLLHIRNVQ
jgi:serine-type D-Ala-D-Ala carboxypeptidase/endopeptidase (penicillin-binding protein 4)